MTTREFCGTCEEYLHPKEYEWVPIAGYIIVFVVALIGNVLGECQPAAPAGGHHVHSASGLSIPLPAGMHTKRSLLLGGGLLLLLLLFSTEVFGF